MIIASCNTCHFFNPLPAADNQKEGRIPSEKSIGRTNLRSASRVSGGIVPADPMWLDGYNVVGLVMANKMYISSRPEHLGDSGNL